MKIKVLFFLILFTCANAFAVTEDEYFNFIIAQSNISLAKFKECDSKLSALIFSSKKDQLPVECSEAEGRYKEIVVKALEGATPQILQKLKSTSAFITVLKDIAGQYYECRKKWVILNDLKTRSIRV
jgi:hypothetical protein